MKSANEASEKQSLPAENQEPKEQEEPQQKRRYRYKLKPKRKLDFSDDDEDEKIVTQSTTTTQTSMPSKAPEEFKVDPSKNFHDEPIIPKDEPIY